MTNINELKALEDKRLELDKEINFLKIKLNNESNNSEWISIPETDYEVTKEVLHKGKSYKEIILLKKPNEKLLTLKQIAMILEDKNLTKELKMDAKYSTQDDFFFKQPFETNESNGYIARFYSGSNLSSSLAWILSFRMVISGYVSSVKGEKGVTNGINTNRF